jgi:hypothetical protein
MHVTTLFFVCRARPANKALLHPARQKEGFGFNSWIHENLRSVAQPPSCNAAAQLMPSIAAVRRRIGAYHPVTIVGQRQCVILCVALFGARLAYGVYREGVRIALEMICRARASALVHLNTRMRKFPG